MATQTINILLQLRHDTEANWTSKNPVLLAGEMAISTDKNGQYKVGNGTSTWSQLEYNKIPWTSVTGRPSTMKNPSALTIQFNGTTNKTYDGGSAQTVNITPAAIGAAPVNGSTSLSKLASTITLGDGGSCTIYQNSSTYHQKVEILDNSSAGDAVFKFSQSSDAGKTFTGLMEIRDDGNIVAKKFTGSLAGNSSTSSSAAKWSTARTISLTGSVTGSVKIDGSGDVSLSTTTNHTHSYIPLSGSAAITGNLEFSNSGTAVRGIIGTVGDNDYWRFIGGATATNAGYVEIASADDGNEPIYVRQYTGKFSSVKRTLTLLDGSGNTFLPGNATVAGSMAVNNDVVVGKCTLHYNTSTESLDFNFT